MARRPIQTFSLSFLDCLCCGFGSVILVFMIISQKITTESQEVVADLQSQALRLTVQTETLAAEVSEDRDALDAAAQELEKKKSELARRRRQLASLDALLAQKRGDVSSSRQSVEEAMKRAATAAAAPEETRDKRGRRELVTGLDMTGKRVLILVDTSGSMLDRYIANIVLLRNMPEARQRKAPKWQQAVSTVDWLLSSILAESKFQVYTFDYEAKPLIEGTAGTWLDVSDDKRVREARRQMRKITPSGGTSLYSAFSAAARLQPPPDNVFLLVDGLPTQGESRSSSETISGDRRLHLFEKAARRLPGSIKVNVILYPLEGDPQAASAYWRLAYESGGAMMSPSSDWP